jgi:hypothetical protein
MKMPKVNKLRIDSKIKQNALRLDIYKVIETFEKDNNYKFESYEIDRVLLDIMVRNHEAYLDGKFGCITE